MKLPIDYGTATWQQRAEAREEYWWIQKGKCYYCKGSLNEDPPKEVTDKKINWSLFPKNFLQHPHHLHHDHDTGMTIGTVHAYCNAVLWQYHDE